MKTKSELLKVKFVTNKFNGAVLEVLQKDPYGASAPEPPSENHLYIRDIKSTSSSFYRGSYATVNDINNVL